MRAKIASPRWPAVLSLTTLFLCLLDSPASARPDAAPPAPVGADAAPPAPEGAGAVAALPLKRDPAPADSDRSAVSETMLLLFQPADEPSRWKVNFDSREKRDLPGLTAPGFMNQRGEYRGGRFKLHAEMGDLLVRETPHTLPELSRKGGRLALQSGDAGNSLRLETFAMPTQGSDSDTLLVGATGELSLLADSARFKTIYLSETESHHPFGKRSDSGARKGSVLGFVTVLEPFPGKLAAEAEVDFALIDPDAADDAAALRDRAYRVKVGGALQNYSYSALYEATGPEYRAIAGYQPKRDREGMAWNLAADFQRHTLGVNLSRYNDNTGNSELYPRLYRYEGALDYAFKGIAGLPLGLQYRKTLLESIREPAGVAPRQADSDTVSGKMNLLARNWDFGFRGNYMQRNDRLLEVREMAATTLAFSPKFTAGTVVVAPAFSVGRSTNYLAKLEKETLAVNLDVTGGLIGKFLDYELRSGFTKERNSALTGKETIGAKVKLSCNLKNFLDKALMPSVAVKGEYNRSVFAQSLSSRSDYALLLLIDSDQSVF